MVAIAKVLIVTTSVVVAAAAATTVATADLAIDILVAANPVVIAVIIVTAVVVVAAIFVAVAVVVVMSSLSRSFLSLSPRVGHHGVGASVRRRRDGVDAVACHEWCGSDEQGWPVREGRGRQRCCGRRCPAPAR
ncbi:hypothetical protein EDB85DRAFT_1998312, partial [Lactarius pseudohatsudake]